MEMSAESTPGRCANLSRDSVQKLLQLATVAALLAAFVGGKYSFGRFIDETAANSWLELRLWFTVATVAGIALRQGLFSIRQLFRCSGQMKWLLASVIVFNVALLIHATLFATPETKLYYAIDAIYVALHAILFAWMFRTREDIMAAVYVAEAMAMAFFVLVLLGFRNIVIDGLGWAPFGSPITFYRLEFLACCGALYAMTVSYRNDIRLFHLVIASIALFSTLSSLSRAALFSSVVVASYLVLLFLVTARQKRAIFVGLFFLAVTAFFFRSGFDIVRERLSELQVSGAAENSIPVSQPAATVNKAPNAAPSVIPPSANVTARPTVPSTVTTKTPPLAAPVAGAIPQPAVPPKTNVDDADELMRTNHVMLNDSTYRIRLFMHAWDLFENHKLLGSGFGHFEIKARNYLGNALVTYHYPHNVFLEVLSATGLAGMALFSFVVLVGLVVLHQAIRLDTNWAYLAAYPLSVLLSALTAGDIYDFRGFFLTTIMIVGAAWPQNA
jgi:O-Antigen ligase